MRSDAPKPRSTPSAVIFDLLNPIPFGFFVGALIFDAIYFQSADVMWFKVAAWLISIGLVIAVIPRLIHLVRVWFSGANARTGRTMLAFLLYLLGVVAAIVNAFVHSRDAYGVMPEGLLLSILTVALMSAAIVLETLQHQAWYGRSDTGPYIATDNKNKVQA